MQLIPIKMFISHLSKFEICFLNSCRENNYNKKKKIVVLVEIEKLRFACSEIAFSTKFAIGAKLCFAAVYVKKLPISLEEIIWSSERKL